MNDMKFFNLILRGVKVKGFATPLESQRIANIIYNIWKDQKKQFMKIDYLSINEQFYYQSES